MSNFSKGSMWRRWDLHLHTPGTMKEDEYQGSSLDEKWDRFYADLARYMGDGSDPLKRISVLGITDYLSIDNYMKVITDNKLPACVELVIPNVEMRIQIKAGSEPVNIHFLFNPCIVNDIEARFFSKLTLNVGGTRYSAARSELTRLGHDRNPELNGDLAYRAGVCNFTLSIDNIVDVLSDQSLRDDVLVFVANGTQDGVSGVCGPGGQLELVKHSIYRLADGIFSANPGDIAFFSGTKAGIPKEKVIKECGSLKPCVHGCDAHCNERLFEPIGRRYCWIKADPTFNGLKQIIYEPTERVRISEGIPEVKTPYYVIQNVIFTDDNFQTEPVEFSANLTCIIGGKSTGKSTLLRNLALSVDRKQVADKEKLTRTTTIEVENLVAFWADGKISSDRKIIYIPQTYLNRLSDSGEVTTEIDKMIEEIIFLNPQIHDNHCKMVANIKEHKTMLAKRILDCLELHKLLIGARDEAKELGEKSAIQEEIERLKHQRNLLAHDSSITPEEQQRYDSAQADILRLQEFMQVTQNDINYLLVLTSVVARLNISNDLSVDTHNAINAAAVKAVVEADKIWTDARAGIIKGLEKQLAEQHAHIDIAKNTIAELNPKVQGNQALAEVIEKLRKEEVKLSAFFALEKKSDDLMLAEKKAVDELAHSVVFFFEQHNNFAVTVKGKTEKPDQELSFSVATLLRKDAFIEKITSLLNTRDANFKKLIDQEHFTDETYSQDFMTSIIGAILSDSLIPKGGNTKETILRDILDDWYNTKYNVIMDNDDIRIMSPGKKALVLLKMLIDLAESNCPILIDQPEDDLDNRSVFDDLIPFIKEKKKMRQIIVVTHNANVVLGADAEMVIIANQQGANSANKSKRFEYRSGSIENNLPILKSDKTIEDGILSRKGIDAHICDILEGGQDAFKLRKQKYHI